MSHAGLCDEGLRRFSLKIKGLDLIYPHIYLRKSDLQFFSILLQFGCLLRLFAILFLRPSVLRFFF
jgi:hypothetical protein